MILLPLAAIAIDLSSINLKQDNCCVGTVAADLIAVDAVAEAACSVIAPLGLLVADVFGMSLAVAFLHDAVFGDDYSKRKR